MQDISTSEYKYNEMTIIIVFYFSQSVLSVFRALHTLERTVDRCALNLDLDENKLVFVFHCKHGELVTKLLVYMYSTKGENQLA